MNRNYYYALIGAKPGGGSSTPPSGGLYPQALSLGSEIPCIFDGPWETEVWTNNPDWQEVTLVTIDPKGTQPFDGQRLFYSLGTDAGMGTTLQIDEAGRVTLVVAC